MHIEVLNKNQVDLLRLIKLFNREFYLVGGTAIALYLGHRRSIDFDLFKKSSFSNNRILDKIKNNGFRYSVTRNVRGQLNLIVNEVKITFFEYPYNIQPLATFDKVVKLPKLIDLAAMKAFALGRRSKWKDYVDIYFLIRDHFSINEISKKAKEFFEDQFSDKLFRAQLSYFNDIDYTEPIEYLCEPVDEETIKSFLIEKAINLES